jgi:hypothetical protein
VRARREGNQTSRTNPAWITPRRSTEQENPPRGIRPACTTTSRTMYRCGQMRQRFLDPSPLSFRMQRDNIVISSQKGRAPPPNRSA